VTPQGPVDRKGLADRPREAARLQSRSEWLRVGLFLASITLLAGTFAFTALMVQRLSQQVSATSEVLARLCAQASFGATRDPQLQVILRSLIERIDFPIVITDERGVPRAWHGVGLATAMVPDESIDSLSQGLAVAPVIADRVDHIRAQARQLDRRNAPIAMTHPVTGAMLGSLHYGDPPLLERLRWMPYLTLGGLALMIGLGLWGLTGIRRAERRTIWVGMALETAHQLGTPLSSLLGWIELLKSRLEESEGPGFDANVVSIPRAELYETLGEMERDVERLTKVAQRFSHVGSAPRLQRQDVTTIVRRVVDYMRPRVPRGEQPVTIEEDYGPVPLLPCNRELLEWAIENLLANAVSALDARAGRIVVGLAPRPSGGAEIMVRDNGRGMTATEQRRAFEPGYTTKPRGWGLGLALARRVVEDYHGGRLFIRKSVPGEGTTVVIALPG
jgi:signal transduction histidine kinase